MDIEKILAESASIEKREAPPEAWPFIAEALHPKKKRRAVWLFFLAALATSGVMFLWIQFAKKDIKQVQTTATNSTTTKNDFPTTTMHKTIDSNNAINYVAVKKIEQIILEQQERQSTATFIANKKATIINKVKIPKTVNTKRKNKERKTLQTEAQIEIPPNNTSNLEDIASIPNTNNLAIEVIDTNTTMTSESTAKPNLSSIQENSKDSKMAKQKVIAKTKKWNYLIQASYGALYIHRNNLFSGGQQKSNMQNQFSVGTTSSIPRNYIANYNTGTNFSFGMLVEKAVPKKMHIQVGFALAYNKYTAIVFKASNASISVLNNALQTDSAASSSNSYYATSPTTADVAGYNIKSNNLSLGAIIGAKVQLMKLSKFGGIKLQTQLTPSFYLAKSNLWFNKENGRYFTNKKVDANFQLAQNISLLWHINTKQKQFAFGPTYQFGWLKNNKTIINLQNVHTSALGVQLQYYFKK